MRLLHVRARKAVTVRDLLFLLGFGAALVVGAHVYAVTGWPMPGLIDKGD